MGMIIQARDFFPEKQKGLLKPIIYCHTYGDVDKEAISINMTLAEKLMKYRPNQRTMQLERCFNQVISELSHDAVIKDFDVMFNPAYQVDIITLLIVAFKKKTFCAIWPGGYSDGKLYYSVEGRPDYKIYCIDDYDVTCIV